MPDEFDRWLTSQLQSALPEESQPPHETARYLRRGPGRWGQLVRRLRLAPRVGVIVVGLVGAALLAGGATAAVHLITAPARPAPSPSHPAAAAGCPTARDCSGPSPSPDRHRGGSIGSPSPPRPGGSAASRLSPSNTPGSGHRHGRPSSPPGKGSGANGKGNSSGNGTGSGGAPGHPTPTP